MPARLILNADDFGLTPGINRAVEELHRAGVLTSTTLMANGPAFEDAVSIARRNPRLGIGCHVVLTDGIPISPPHLIASLLGKDRATFRPSLFRFAQAALTGQLRENEIFTEALAQIRKLKDAGIHVTHLDTHKHAHLFPAVIRPLLEAARHASVLAIRNPFEPPWSLALDHGLTTRRLQIKSLATLQPRFRALIHLHNRQINTTGGTLGISATGKLDPHTLRELLAHLPPGTWELVCHPGYNDSGLDRIRTRLRSHRDVERLALLSAVPEALARPGAPSLIHFGNLPGVATTHIPERPR